MVLITTATFYTYSEYAEYIRLMGKEGKKNFLARNVIKFYLHFTEVRD
jgi:hypothetical protein